MLPLPAVAAKLLTGIFLLGLAGSVVVIVLFVADLLRVIFAGQEHASPTIGNGL